MAGAQIGYLVTLRIVRRLGERLVGGQRPAWGDGVSGMKAWVDFLNSRAQDHIVGYSYYGDWAPPIHMGVAGYSANNQSCYNILMMRSPSKIRKRN
jgi:hypothetical protein